MVEEKHFVMAYAHIAYCKRNCFLFGEDMD